MPMPSRTVVAPRTLRLDEKPPLWVPYTAGDSDKSPPVIHRPSNDGLAAKSFDASTPTASPSDLSLSDLALGADGQENSAFIGLGRRWMDVKAANVVLEARSAWKHADLVVAICVFL
ncbi:hypothetical protein BJ912DRAFT_1059331 [Pholiota molesta]|nr:hypothetical protein BJ912DRAFT_1059331 [Pholiota molesta]